MLKTIYKGKYRYIAIDPKGKDRLININYEKQKKILGFWITVDRVANVEL